MGVFGFPTLQGALPAHLVAAQIDGPQARSSRHRMVIAETIATHPANVTHRFHRRPEIPITVFKASCGAVLERVPDAEARAHHAPG